MEARIYERPAKHRRTATDGLRRALRIAEREALRDRDGLLTPADLQRLIWSAICESAERSGRDREEREELTARLAAAIGETLREAGRGEVRASDLPDIRKAVAAKVEAVRRDYRREVEGVLRLDQETGDGSTLLEAVAETAKLRGQREAERSRRANQPTCRCAEREADREGRNPGARASAKVKRHTCGDPAPDWLRVALDGRPASHRAVALGAMSPAVTSEEWASAEKVAKPATYRKRESEGREVLARNPGMLAELCAAIGELEPEDWNPIRRALRFIAGPGYESPAVAARPDRETEPAETLPKLRSRKGFGSGLPREDWPVRTPAERKRWRPRRTATPRPLPEGWTLRERQERKRQLIAPVAEWAMPTPAEIRKRKRAEARAAKRTSSAPPEVETGGLAKVATRKVSKAERAKLRKLETARRPRRESEAERIARTGLVGSAASAAAHTLRLRSIPIGPRA